MLQPYIDKILIPGLNLSPYEEPNRHYHNRQHIEKIWDVYETKYLDENDPETTQKMFYTTIFHDIVYVPGSKTNEIDSAQEFLKFFQCGNRYLNPFFAEVYDTILASRNHWDAANRYLPEWSKLFLDLDIYEIGGTKEVYRENGEKILQEFQTVFTKTDVLKGRRDWLKGVAMNDTLYWTMEAERGAQARKNILENLVELENI